MANKSFGKIGLAVALVALGYALGHYSLPVAHAQDTYQIGHNVIPKNWGHVAAASGNFLVLEDDLGNIHMYNIYTHQPMGDLGRK